MEEHSLYECGICSCLHLWDWDGDCRDNNARYGDAEEYATSQGISAFDVTVFSWEERIEADNA